MIAGPILTYLSLNGTPGRPARFGPYYQESVTFEAAAAVLGLPLPASVAAELDFVTEEDAAPVLLLPATSATEIDFTLAVQEEIKNVG